MSTLVRVIAWVLFFNAAIVAVLLVWEGWRRVSALRKRDRASATPARIRADSVAFQDQPQARDSSADKSLQAIRTRHHAVRLPGPGPRIEAIYRNSIALPWRHR